MDVGLLRVHLPKWSPWLLKGAGMQGGWLGMGWTDVLGMQQNQKTSLPTREMRFEWWGVVPKSECVQGECEFFVQLHNKEGHLLQNE